jgi:hypothetical protein
MRHDRCGVCPWPPSCRRQRRGARARGRLADGGPLRQRARGIGRLAGDDRRRQRHAERIAHRHGALPLRQIGAMLLAVSQLAQPCGRHGGASRRGIDAHHAAWPVIDAPHGLRAVACQRGPAFRDRQGVEGRRQPLIGAITWLHLAAETPTQGALVCCAPRLDTREPVVALGEEAGEPYDGRLAETQALPMAMGREVVVQACGHTPFLEVRDHGWYVVDSFVGCCDFFAHPTSVTQCSFSRENSRETSVLRNNSTIVVSLFVSCRIVKKLMRLRVRSI